ncbi:MAG TPA: hypothetical protein VE053_04740 [Allosphingosinicella sp.]|nr:hypothetical protein [Allosphingosinicella sp.]
MQSKAVDVPVSKRVLLVKGRAELGGEAGQAARAAVPLGLVSLIFRPSCHKQVRLFRGKLNN